MDTGLCVRLHGGCIATQLDGPLVRFGTPCVGDERYPQTMRMHCELCAHVRGASSNTDGEVVGTAG